MAHLLQTSSAQNEGVEQNVYMHDEPDEALQHWITEYKLSNIAPKLYEESKTYDDGSPFLSMDGNRVYFFSDRPTPESDSTWHIQLDFNIWYLQKEGNDWSEPKWMNSLPNTKDNWEFDICQIKDGSFYYTRNNINNIKTKFGIVKSLFINGKFSAPEVLGKQFNDGNKNWSPYVNPDETYIIFSSNRENPDIGNKGCDLYISYRKNNGDWTDPINMGPIINKKGIIERFPYVSPNGKYLFFVRGYGDIYWMDAGIIEELNSKD